MANPLEQPPIGLHWQHGPGCAAKIRAERGNHIKGRAKGLFERGATIREAAEDQVPAAGKLKPREPEAKLPRLASKGVLAIGDAGRDALGVEAPMVEAANDRAMATLRQAQRVGAVRAAILEPAQPVAKPLHEH